MPNGERELFNYVILSTPPSNSVSNYVLLLEGCPRDLKISVLHPLPLEAPKASWGEKGSEPLIVNSCKGSKLHFNERGFPPEPQNYTSICTQSIPNWEVPDSSDSTYPNSLSVVSSF